MKYKSAQSWIAKSLATLFVSVFLSCGSYGDSAGTAISFLFVVGAEAGTYADGKLTLEGVQEYVIAFSDRPERVAMRISADTFVGDWTTYGFKKDPPDAALIFEGASSEASDNTVALELSNPRFSQNALTFDVEIIEISSRLADIVSNKVDTIPSSFEDVHLFIDDATSIEEQCDKLYEMGSPDWERCVAD